MAGNDIVTARTARGWTQAQLASRLGVSQPYVSLLERNRRVVPTQLARRLSQVLHLPPDSLPMGSTDAPLSLHTAASALARIGYPGFAYLRNGPKLNPAECLLRTLAARTVDARLLEALPWLLQRYTDLDWPLVVRKAKEHDLQNRLGFVLTVAREAAEGRSDARVAGQLARWEQVLERSRLQQEETFRDSLTEAERRWLRAKRSPAAQKWNVLSTLTDRDVQHAP